MKTLILGLDGVDAGQFLSDARLIHLRHLMQLGGFGRLDGVDPSVSSKNWRTLAAGNEEGAPSPMLWHLLGDGGGRSIVMEVPNEPPTLDGVGASLQIIPARENGAEWAITAQPPDLADEIRPTLTSVPDFDDEPADRIVALSANRFRAFRHLLSHRDWTFAQLIDDSPARLRQVFGDNRADEAIGAYLLLLDGELGSILEHVPPDGDGSTVLVASIRSGDPDGGAFVLASTAGSPSMESESVGLSDLAPTLLAIAGLDVPPTMTGRALTIGPPSGSSIDEDEQAVLERLRGLGYIP